MFKNTYKKRTKTRSVSAANNSTYSSSVSSQKTYSCHSNYIIINNTHSEIKYDFNFKKTVNTHPDPKIIIMTIKTIMIHTHAHNGVHDIYLV